MVCLFLTFHFKSIYVDFPFFFFFICCSVWEVSTDIASGSLNYFLNCVSVGSETSAFFISVMCFWFLTFHSDSLLEYLCLYLSSSSYLFSSFSSSSLSILITFVLNCWSDSYDHTCHPPSCNTVRQISAQSLELDCLYFNFVSASQWCNFWQHTEILSTSISSLVNWKHS